MQRVNKNVHIFSDWPRNILSIFMLFPTESPFKLNPWIHQDELQLHLHSTFLGATILRTASSLEMAAAVCPYVYVCPCVID